VVCIEGSTKTFAVRDYDLDATLTSGQAFRWIRQGDTWMGVVANRWVGLRVNESFITAETAEPVADWAWLTHYLQLDLDFDAVLRSFPKDPPMRLAIKACRGLRLLRQDPWECLASFILSSTKQILQIRQIISLLCERYGSALPAANGHFPIYSFPGPERLAGLTESDLRECKMGFRAPFLLSAACAVAEGTIDLAALHRMPLEAARADLLTLRGVGRKISDCVLLFAFGHATAFPVDVWIMKTLRQLYFPGRKVNLRQLQEFAETHFGRHAGYAQQYLFHYARLKANRLSSR
jgi:N-glycosylase/DNA lyase